MTRGIPMACVLAALIGCGGAPDPAPAVASGAQDAQAANVAKRASNRRTPDTRRIHALIVGIDHYRYSDAHQPSAVFSDLRGAVGDALRFKQALAELYGVDVDTPVRGACDSSNAATTTLIDDCATRARILESLEQRIATLHPGDTLLFYFAGHGSRYRDDEARDQDTGYNGTVLPTDARNPDGSPGDIFDIELKALKDRATAAGLYFVSVFDSCNSATATRDGAAGQSRSAPPLVGVAPTIGVAAPEAAKASAPAEGGVPASARVSAMATGDVNATQSHARDDGYWVHLAAAQDGEEAQETGGGAVGARAGVFTTALIETLRMPGMRDATFGDVIREVRLRVGARGHATQTPSAEGTLTAAMGSRARTAVLYDVEQAGTATTLRAGSLSGITRGSRFALYASQADAMARRAQVATASVTTLDANTATLAFDAAPQATPPPRLVAEEIAHFLPADSLTVAIDLPAGPARDAADAAVRASGFATVSTAGGIRLVAAVDDANAPTHTDAVALRADDGTLLAASLGRAEDPAFAERLATALRKLARVQQLLALRTGGAGGSAADPFPVTACIAPDGYRPTACPPLQAGGIRRIGTDARFTVTVVNRGARPAYVYVLAIDPLAAVDPVLPKRGEFDQALPPNQPYRVSNMSFDTPGVYRFVVIASARPIRADAFAQAGTGTRDIGTCSSPLERLLCASSEGRRDVGVAAVGDWSAQVSTVLVTARETP